MPLALAPPDSSRRHRRGGGLLKHAVEPTPRARIWVREVAGLDLELDVARSTEAYDAAFRLVHDQYVARGLMRRTPSGRRLGLHHAHPQTKVFIARLRGRVVGTVTLIPDSPIGLPTDSLYAEELAGLRQAGRRVAEVSALAMSVESRSLSLYVLMRMLRMVLLYAALYKRLDDLFLAVHPRHGAFHRATFGFEQVGDLRSYGAVAGAPAVGLRLDLDGVRDLIAQGARVGFDGDPHLGFLYSRESVMAVMRDLAWRLPGSSLSSQQFNHFFAGEAVWTSAPAEARGFVRSLYPAAEEPPAAARPVTLPAIPELSTVIA